VPDATQTPVAETTVTTARPLRDAALNPALTRKREKRTVENDQFAAFARRILRAYARRVADGDVEALRSLVCLSSDVDALTRESVKGLREFGYSWADIAGRLGVTRQAAQQRWGDPADRGAVDRRLLAAGLDVTVALLVTLFADHHPGKPAAAQCPGCGHVYSEDEDDCPTNTVVRPLLYRRRNEHKASLSGLTPVQYEDLMTPPATSRARRSYPRPVRPPGLFD
jgi:hypothetical protein